MYISALYANALKEQLKRAEEVAEAARIHYQYGTKATRSSLFDAIRKHDGNYYNPYDI